jgi:hypothetical protein
MTQATRDLTQAELSELNNDELLQLIQLLETTEVGTLPAREYDHRKYLERHELERIFLLLRWLRRSRGTAAEVVVPASPVVLPNQVAV